MTLPVPRIAVLQPTSNDDAYNQRSLPQYIRAIELAGGVAVVLPLSDSSTTLSRLAATCAGILLPGSPADVAPGQYGQDVVEECAEADSSREAADRLLLSDAEESGKPVFGICFGLQSLNVWRKGSLIQHLPQAPTAAVDHQPGREVQDAHDIEITSGSKLRQILRTDGVTVNSSHHQAIASVGELLSVAARSPVDGVIEAIEGRDPKQFLVGVQWHPERSYEKSEASRRLFSAFIEAAKAWVSSRPE